VTFNPSSPPCPLALSVRMIPFPPPPSLSQRKRPRSTLQVQTASCLLSAAAVLTVSIMPLGTAASFVGTSTLSVTPSASPATSPVVAYFGHDVHSKSDERSGHSVVMGDSLMDINETDQDSQRAYVESTASYPLSAGASSFLLQVDSPTEERLHPGSPSSDGFESLQRRTRRSRPGSDVWHVRADSPASISDDGSPRFTANNNIASTFAPSSSSATATISSLNTPSPTTSTTPTNFPAAPASALPLSGPFPQPFDQSLSYSLADSCVAFLARYLESEQMTGRVKGVKTKKGGVGKCGRPFGLLVSSSSRWAQM
jgi:hypothetical protein